jgi:hypothetical protein
MQDVTSSNLVRSTSVLISCRPITYCMDTRSLAVTFYIIGLTFTVVGLAGNMTFLILGVTFVLLANTYHPIASIHTLFINQKDEDVEQPPREPRVK